MLLYHISWRHTHKLSLGGGGSEREERANHHYKSCTACLRVVFKGNRLHPSWARLQSQSSLSAPLQADPPHRPPPSAPASGRERGLALSHACRKRGTTKCRKRTLRGRHCRTATAGSAGGARVVWGIRDQIIRLGLLRSHTVSQALAVPNGSIVGLYRVYRLEQIAHFNDGDRP